MNSYKKLHQEIRKMQKIVEHHTDKFELYHEKGTLKNGTTPVPWTSSVTPGVERSPRIGRFEQVLNLAGAEISDAKAYCGMINQAG